MYTKKNWINGERITAEALNNIENGIFECDRTNASAWSKLYELEDTTEAVSAQVSAQTQNINQANQKIDGFISTVDTFAYNRGILIDSTYLINGDNIGNANKIYAIKGGFVHNIGDGSTNPIADYNRDTGEITIKTDGTYAAFCGASVWANRAVMTLDGYNMIASMQIGSNTTNRINETFSGFRSFSANANQKYKLEIALQAGTVEKDASASGCWLMLLRI